MGSISVSTKVELNAISEKSFLLLVLFEQRRVVQLAESGDLASFVHGDPRSCSVHPVLQPCATVQ